LRLIELVLPERRCGELQELIKDWKSLGIWHQELSDDKVLVRVLLSMEETEATLDILEKQFSTSEGFRVMLMPVEATIPRPEIPEEESQPEQSEQQAEEAPERISREELYQDIVDAARITRVYILMTVLSSVVAAIGLLGNNVAVIIGAMVIAPLLGPNVAFSLSVTLGDMGLARSSLKTNIVGILTSLGLSVAVGLIFTITPGIPEIASRTTVGIGNIILALASGSAGALAFTTGVSATLIGVMVAVALLPPLVTFGMLLGAGYYYEASGAMLLLFTNLICVNLAGTMTFLFQGIRPVTWWEADKAKRATRIAILLGASLLLILTVIILFSHRR
ncbi:MAG: TIGR00341 family protein, partial [Candidatus Sulfobium sp.]